MALLFAGVGSFEYLNFDGRTAQHSTGKERERGKWNLAWSWVE